MHVYKIFLKEEWEAMQIAGQTEGAPIDLADGYIHFSTTETVAETARKYFAAVDGLMLVAIEASQCSPMKWEPSRGGALFPHLYRALEMDDVIWAKPLPACAEGHTFPAGVL